VDECKPLPWGTCIIGVGASGLSRIGAGNQGLPTSVCVSVCIQKWTRLTGQPKHLDYRPVYLHLFASGVIPA
jgi:hypothetical protein